MSYFAASNHAPAPELEPPVALQLWPDGAGYMLTWRRALGRVDGYVVLQGKSLATLAPVARVAASTLRWQVEVASGPVLAVACVRGAVTSPASTCVSFAAEADAAPLATVGEIAAEQQVTAWAYGDCRCCNPAEPLLPEAGALICGRSGEAHLALSDGTVLRVAELPFGVCVCCDPPQPLVRAGAVVVCYSRSDQTYTRQGAAWRPLVQRTQQALTDANAIDAALRANSALLGTNGLFVSED